MSLKNIAKILIKPLYKKAQFFRYRELFRKNKNLANRYSGSRIIILGDGVSLKAVDLKKLKNEYTFGCNNLMLHNDFESLDLSFYANISPWRRVKEIESPAGTFENGLQRLHVGVQGGTTKFFFDISLKKIVDGKFLDRETYYVVAGKSLWETRRIMFDVSKPVSTTDGSIYFMIATSIFMGFKEIYLCGSGYTYFPRQSGHFYENFEVKEDVDLDPRHLLMKRMAEANGVTIYNVTPEGFESPVYQKVSVADFYRALGVG